MRGGRSKDEESEDAGQDLLGLVLQLLRGRAGQRVRNEGKGIARRAMRLGDGLAIRDETIGADGCGWSAASLQEDAVQHTAG